MYWTIQYITSNYVDSLKKTEIIMYVYSGLKIWKVWYTMKSEWVEFLYFIRHIHQLNDEQDK